ncbi:MAG TPA: cytochrome oxidase [Candidatus Scalindua sp.]|nr:cytochrome oxidase [Candidatus Scalindua sp.]
MEEKLVNNNLVKSYIYSSFFWLIIAPLIGFAAAIELNYPDVFSGLPIMSFSRLRIVHVNGVVFGWFTTAIFGLCFYIVPKLTGVKLFSERLAIFTLWLWNITIFIGVTLIALGINQGLEVAEFPILVDLSVTACFALILINLFGTIFKRKEKKLYVSLWYVMGAFVWTTMNYIMGNFINPYFVSGTNSAAMHGFYIHNVVGLWITPIGVAMVYYFLPVSVKSPLYSHRLSLIGFWTIAFLYPFVGTHHYIFSPIPDWVETLAIVYSMWLFIPVWTVVYNFFGTMKGKWKNLAGDPVVGFLIVGIIFYLITCFQGPTQALRSMQKMVHFTDWVVGHAHIAIFGTFTLWTYASIYYIWPKITGRELYSPVLTRWHFWLSVLGFSLMATSLTAAGLIQGSMLFNNEFFIKTFTAIKPYWLARTIGGLAMDIGMFIFVYNMYKTVRHGKVIN